jgi:hypothetical protein
MHKSYMLGIEPHTYTSIYLVNTVPVCISLVVTVCAVGLMESRQRPLGVRLCASIRIGLASDWSYTFS